MQAFACVSGVVQVPHVHITAGMFTAYDKEAVAAAIDDICGACRGAGVDIPDTAASQLKAALKLPL